MYIVVQLWSWLNNCNTKNVGENLRIKKNLLYIKYVGAYF